MTLAEALGLLAALCGAIGALLLVRPLFILLDQREGLDALVQVLDGDLAPEEFRKYFGDARALLAACVFAGRRGWKRWAYAGTGALVASLLLTVAQAAASLLR